MKFGNSRIRRAHATAEVQAEAEAVGSNPGKKRAQARQHGMRAYAPTDRLESETEETIARHISVSIFCVSDL